jgi:hypothetical protein
VTAFDQMRDRLIDHGSRIAEVRQNHFMAQCPAHEDGRPSLGVDYQPNHGRLMVRCYADCQTDDVMKELGLELRDLFDEEPDTSKAVPIRSYVYRKTDGQPMFIVDRYWPKTFRQRKPDTLPGDTGGIKGIEPILFHADKVWQRMKAEPTTVYLVDGERDVETAEQHGLVATTPPGFGKKWRDTYTSFLRHAKEVVIVVDQDELKADGSLGPGQTFALAARSALRAETVKVRVVAPAVGKDLSDHFAGGYGPDDFQVEPTASVRPRGLDASSLMTQEFEPVEFIVDKILPEGLTILAGSPKVGKSWVALDFCLAVALGGRALSVVPCTQGNVLYLAREDSYRRLQSRIALVMGGSMEAPKDLELVPQEHDWIGGEEGLANLSEWAEEVRNPKLVVLDTLARVEPEMGEDSRRGVYAGNYSMMARYKRWADQHHLAVLAVHHDRKGDSGASKTGMAADPFTKISGTRGLTGAADTLMFLESIRGTRTGELHVTGRDVAEQSLELHKAGPLWSASTQPE